MTAPQAMRYGSLATRMMQIFVVGEKYLTASVLSVFLTADTRVVPFSELPTAPQPVSPKFTITLCFNAAYICLESRAVDCWLG